MVVTLSITNPYAKYISPAGECATVLGQSKNCSSMLGIKLSLKSINELEKHINFETIFLILEYEST